MYLRGVSTLERLTRLGASRCLLWTDADCGLRAVAVIDDLRRGPSAGGIRTGRYASLDDAIAEAAGLARAMTYKCALGHIDAGGCKIVVLDHDGMNRAAAFHRLGQLVHELGGLIRTAGDLGTRADDLRLAAEGSPFVHTDEASLCGSVARGLVGCVRAWVEHREGKRPERLDGLRVAIQGCGSIGAMVAASLHAQGASLCVADIVDDRARAVAEATGADIAGPAAILSLEADVVVPCAAGGVIDVDVANALRCRAIVGAANNILRDTAAGQRLVARDIDFVPDVIASAGAVIDGVGHTVMGLTDRGPLIDRLADTALEVLQRAQRGGRPPGEVAIALAKQRLVART